MSRSQSRRRQRQLERELFGPEPSPQRERSRSKRSSPPPPPGVPGDCWACGNCCEPYRDPWTCPFCGVTYPPVTLEASP